MPHIVDIIDRQAAVRFQLTPDELRRLCGTTRPDLGPSKAVWAGDRVKRVKCRVVRPKLLPE